jgi:hypothetical protein
LAVLQQHDYDQEDTNQYVNGGNQINHVFLGARKGLVR